MIITDLTEELELSMTVMQPEIATEFCRTGSYQRGIFAISEYSDDEILDTAFMLNGNIWIMYRYFETTDIVRFFGFGGNYGLDVPYEQKRIDVLRSEKPVQLGFDNVKLKYYVDESVGELI